MIPLRLEGLGKAWPRAPRPALAEVTLAAAPGELLTVVGASGSGKTTLLRLIAGLEEPTSGTITIAERVVAGGGRPVPPELRGVGMVFQDLALFPHLRVAENVAFGLPRGADARVAELLALVGCDEFAGRFPHELSGGQRQRIALARALAPAPAVVLLDEPFSSLDAVLKRQVRDEVVSILRRAGTTALLVLHDPDDALSIGDRVAVLECGRLAQLDAPRMVYRRPATAAVARLFGFVDLLPTWHDEGGLACCALGRLPLGWTAAQVGIRPEAIHLASPDAPDATPAVVARVAFCGALLEVTLTVDDRGTPRPLSIYLPADAAISPGDRIGVRAAAGDFFPVGLGVNGER
jgi:iron(III) transport system ATP-binding protein